MEVLSAQGGEEEEEQDGEGTGPRWSDARGAGLRGAFLLAGSVTQRRVAAGDAHGVELAGAELLVARGGDETGSRGGAGLTVVNPVFFHQHLLLAHVLHVDGAVDDELRRGAVVCHLLALVALDLQSPPWPEEEQEHR